MKTLEQLRERLAFYREDLKRDEEHALDALRTWTRKLAEELEDREVGEPAYQLKWGEEAYDNGGFLLAVRSVNAYLSTDGSTFAAALGVAKERALLGARSPERSSSATSNRYHEAVTKAWARLVEKLESGVRTEMEIASR